jgi:hypothetical protein
MNYYSVCRVCELFWRPFKTLNPLSTRILIAVFFLQLVTGPSIAQHYYPGGLGNTNLLLWLDANKGSSITQNGSNQVSEWADLSGNGYNFQQTTAANEPVFSSTGGPNSKPALTFNASSDQYLSSQANLPAFSLAAGISTFAMASFNAPLTGQGWQRIYDFGMARVPIIS